jgi:hypothetical protein
LSTQKSRLNRAFKKVAENLRHKPNKMNGRILPIRPFTNLYLQEHSSHALDALFSSFVKMISISAPRIPSIQ